jgi:multimeric flavodoxin WrbA
LRRSRKRADRNEIIAVGDKLSRAAPAAHCRRRAAGVLPDPEFSEILDKIYAADGLQLAAPSITQHQGTWKSFLDRAFLSSTVGQMRFKSASIVVLETGRRDAALTSHTFQLASEMLVAPSGFNVVFGARPCEIQPDGSLAPAQPRK